jgi:hypothetical protein
MKNLFYFSLCLLLVSCFDKDLTEGTTSTRITNSCDDLGYESFDEGDAHNFMLQCVLADFDLCRDATLAEFEEEVKESLISCSQEISQRYNFEQSAFISLVQNVDYQGSEFLGTLHSIGEIINDHNSTALNERVDALTDELEDYGQDLDVEFYQSFICEFYQNTTTLNIDDLKKFGTYSDVLSSSIEFWLPTSQGGLNNLENLTVKMQKDCQGNGSRWCGWCVVLADAAGVVAGAGASLAATGGAAAIPNPALGGLPTASVVGVVVGLGASAQRAIGQIP